MNIMFIIAVVSLALQFGTTAALLILGQAPRWRRVRWFGAVAFTAGCYSLVDAVAALRAPGEPDITWSLRLNLFIATLHGASWLLFTYANRDARWSSMPAWVRYTVIGSSIMVGIASISGVVAAPNRELLLVPMFGVAYERPVLSTVGNLLGTVPFLLLLFAMIGVWQERRRGVEGTTPVLIGFGLFLAATIEELLVASGIVDFIFLGDIGYVCVVVPVTLQLFRRFRDDADQLDALTEHLADEVQRRTQERDSAREQIIEQQRLAALGRLAAGVGHEVNNPLQYLQFNLEELQQHLSMTNDVTARELVQQSFEGVERIRQVVDDLRTYARPGTAEMMSIDVRDVVRTALRVGAPQFRLGVELDVAYNEVPLVMGNEGRLVQVVLNPLVNAAQAMQQQGAPGRNTLHVRTFRARGNEAVIEVRDEGPGFPPDLISQLGEPYVTTKADRGGTGLGLFVSRGIVEAHGGRLEFINAPEGGACVRIRLPGLRTSTPASMPIPVPYGVPIVRKVGDVSRSPVTTILLVEDDQSALRAVVRGLEAEGFAVAGFSDAKQALAWLGANDADLVVTDLMMPGMSGWEFAEALEQTHPELRKSLVVLTGGASTREAQELVRDSSLLVLEKPITRQALASALRARIVASGS